VTVITPESPDADAPRASGTLESHYAPAAKVQLMTALELQQAIDANSSASLAATGRVAVWSRSPLQTPDGTAAHVDVQPMPQSANDCAHQLFAQLRSFDTQGVAHIWVETPPLTPEWDGVRDRLTRAASPTR
jgi:L-threonylcarbamoyladenylate synthase